MSKEYEKFHQNHEDILNNLLESLIVLTNKFDEGIVPGEPEKSDALYMLDVYKDAIDFFSKEEKTYFKRVKQSQTSFNDERAYLELQGLRDSISLIIRLGNEKMIKVEDAVFESEAGRKVIESGYCDEVILEQSGIHYYALSDKGEKLLKSKKIVEKIRKDAPTAVIPGKLILEADKWSDLYARRIEYLKKYFSEKKDNSEYICFTLDDKKEMVFACELSDSLDVTYYFAAVFDEQIDDHIEQVKRLADSGMIDNIVIVDESPEMTRILEDEGIDSNHTPHISIEQL